MVNESLNKLEIDSLLVTPAFISPFKEQVFVEPNKRLEWLRAALPENEKIKICDFEIRQNRPVPTIVTVRHVINEFSPKKIYLIVGADHLRSLSKWNEYNELCRLCEWVIATRDNIIIPIEFLKLNVDYPAASTDVRKLKRAELLPDKLAGEILSYY